MCGKSIVAEPTCRRSAAIMNGWTRRPKVETRGYHLSSLRDFLLSPLRGCTRGRRKKNLRLKPEATACHRSAIFTAVSVRCSPYCRRSAAALVVAINP